VQGCHKPVACSSHCDSCASRFVQSSTVYNFREVHVPSSLLYLLFESNLTTSFNMSIIVDVLSLIYCIITEHVDEPACVLHALSELLVEVISGWFVLAFTEE